jgi:hypothetical protein
MRAKVARMASTGTLSDKAIRAALNKAAALKLSDGGGLRLDVQPTGAGWWRLRYRFDGRERMLSLGTHPDVSLKLARERRDEARELVAAGIDPSAARQAEKVQRAQEQDAQTLAAAGLPMSGMGMIGLGAVGLAIKPGVRLVDLLTDAACLLGAGMDALESITDLAHPTNKQACEQWWAMLYALRAARFAVSRAAEDAQTAGVQHDRA